MAISWIIKNNLIFRCLLHGVPPSRGSAQSKWLIIEDHEPVILTSGAVLTICMCIPFSLLLIAFINDTIYIYINEYMYLLLSHKKYEIHTCIICSKRTDGRNSVCFDWFGCSIQARMTCAPYFMKNIR